jgi:hypothetical protein
MLISGYVSMTYDDFIVGTSKPEKRIGSGDGIESVQFLWPIEGDGLAIMDTKTL